MPLKPHMAEGWYLVFWRAISIDGHPVQSAFTFAIGPNQGPAPQFVVPKISQTATTPRLVIARWAMFLSVMAAIGLFVLRIVIARPVAKRVEGSSLRTVSIAFVIVSILGLIAIPVYLDIATAVDSLRSAFALGALVPSSASPRSAAPMSTSRSASPCSASRRGSRSGSTGRRIDSARSPSSVRRWGRSWRRARWC